MPKVVECKVLLLGDSGVGKTALMNQLCNGKISTLYHATIGADMETTTISAKLPPKRQDDKPKFQQVSLEIWDTAGQKRFQPLAETFYQGAQVVILVFDVTDKDTFLQLQVWKEVFLECTNDDDRTSYVWFVVGNKVDIKGRRQVPQTDATDFCKDPDNSSMNWATYIETSAAKGTFVAEAFKMMAEAYLKQQEDGKAKGSESISFGDEEQGGCSVM